jgi:hypothetical protein
MVLKPTESYKKHDIYKDKEGFFVVYEQSDPVAKEAAKLFVQNDIDINLPIISHRAEDFMTKFDIDYNIILKTYKLV